MNRKSFLAELKSLLSFLDPEERGAVLRYYEEMFDAAGPDGEDQVLRSLGSPVRQVLRVEREFRNGTLNLQPAAAPAPAEEASVAYEEAPVAPVEAPVAYEEADAREPVPESPAPVEETGLMTVPAALVLPVPETQPTEEPMAEMPAPEAPVYEESLPETPAPVIEPSVVSEPVDEEPVILVPITEEPASYEPVVEEPDVYEPAEEESFVPAPAEEASEKAPASEETSAEEDVPEVFSSEPMFTMSEDVGEPVYMEEPAEVPAESAAADAFFTHLSPGLNDAAGAEEAPAGEMPPEKAPMEEAPAKKRSVGAGRVLGAVLVTLPMLALGILGFAVALALGAAFLALGVACGAGAAYCAGYVFGGAITFMPDILLLVGAMLLCAGFALLFLWLGIWLAVEGIILTVRLIALVYRGILGMEDKDNG